MKISEYNYENQEKDEAQRNTIKTRQKLYKTVLRKFKKIYIYKN